jgi:hypothetical protein
MVSVDRPSCDTIPLTASRFRRRFNIFVEIIEFGCYHVETKLV